VCANGDRSLDLLDASPSIDVVITDLAMPDMDGVELARKNPTAIHRGSPFFRSLP